MLERLGAAKDVIYRAWFEERAVAGSRAQKLL